MYLAFVKRHDFCIAMYRCRAYYAISHALPIRLRTVFAYLYAIRINFTELRMLHIMLS